MSVIQVINIFVGDGILNIFSVYIRSVPQPAKNFFEVSMNFHAWINFKKAE